ncbi:MAG: hypothetical protein AAFW82_00315 [Pseudomonadota bacterium]
MLRLRSIFCIALLSTIVASAQAFAANSLICNFPSGMVHTFENDVFQVEVAKTLSFEIGDIDLSGQKASLIATEGKGNLKVVRAIGANHYLEVVAEGYLNVTTVYDEEAADGSLPAVHSRHFGLLGTPVVSQYHGTCKVK